MTLAFEDVNSKLVEVVTVADVDDEDRVGNSLLQIWKRRFGHKVKLLFRLRAQGLVKILKLKFKSSAFGNIFFAYPTQSMVLFYLDKVLVFSGCSQDVFR